MGNCSQKALADDQCTNNIKLVTGSKGIIELKGPKLAKDVLNGYPGYSIFRYEDASSPLARNEYLINGQAYYLLPLQELPLLCESETHEAAERKGLNTNGAVIRRPALEVLPRQGNGVWKVKLVINTKELEEMLASGGNTEALIDKMRMAASFAPARKRKSFWAAVGFNVFKVSSIGGPK